MIKSRDFQIPVVIPAILLLVIGIYSCTTTGDAGYAIHKSAAASGGMVVSAHPLASRAGADILAAGGNAIDAAVATHFALAVVHPRAGNLGGGGFLVFRDASGEAYALDFREEAPGRAHRDMYLDTAGNVIAGMSLHGPMAIAVPGSVAGMAEAHRRFGSLDWSRVLEPAIRYAKEGVLLTQSEAGRLNQYKADFLKWNGSDIPFYRDSAWHKGDRFIQPALGNTLTIIAREGEKAFYQGIIGEQLVNTLDTLGGIITLDDLESYRAVWRTPLETDYKKYTLITMPLPSSGGIVLAQIFEILERFHLAGLKPGSTAAIHLIAEAERRAFADRAEYLGDPDVIDIPVMRLLESTYILDRMSDFSWDSATASSAIETGKAFRLPEHYETTHFSIADQYGNTVAVTATLNDNYGSKVFVTEAGFFLNSQMDDFSAKPGVPNMFGLVGDEANAIAPGKRMLSSMTPSIIERFGEPYLILGAPGGPTIITSVLQVFLNMAEFGMSVDSAVTRKRFHHQWLPDEIRYEAGSISDPVADSLQRLGHTLTQVQSMGSVNAIYIDEHGVSHGAADVRSDCHAEGVEW